MEKSRAYFEKISKLPENRIHLAEAALQIASDEYPELSIDAYLKILGSWQRKLRRGSAQLSVASRIDLINDLLFERMRFAGNIENYYDPKNSYLNDVIDTRKGIPISLSIIYLELAWSLGLNAAGVGFPGHFLVRVIRENQPVYIDPFHKGKLLTVEDCKEFWENISEGELEFQNSFLSSISKSEILSRMLRNLKGIYLEQKDFPKVLQILDKLIAINPESAEEYRDRGVVHYQMQAYRLALKDFEVFLSRSDEPEEIEMIQQYLQILREYASHLN